MEDIKESTVHVDPSGNLTLIVGPEDNQKAFTVSSAAMCLASPVWRAMLDPKGHFLEAHSSDRKVSFPDDNPEALLLLLNVIHLQFLKVPQTLPTEELYEVAVLCDKYDTVTVVRPVSPLSKLTFALPYPELLGNTPSGHKFLLFTNMSGECPFGTKISILTNLYCLSKLRLVDGILILSLGSGSKDGS